MNIIILIVATPVIVLTISIIAFVSTAPAGGTHIFSITSSLEMNVALCVFICHPVLIDCIRACTYTILYSSLLKVMTKDGCCAKAPVRAILVPDIISLVLLHASVPVAPRFRASLSTSDKENSQSCN